MKRKAFALLGFVILGLGLMALSVRKSDPIVIYNPSESAPVGWYLVVDRKQVFVGDVVASWLPQEAADFANKRGYLPKDIPVIKTVAAGPGDTYCVEDQMLKLATDWSVPILHIDGQGRALPALAGGCRSLSAGEYLLISERVLTSFDSRYFGPVGRDNIIGRAEYGGDIRGLFGWRSGQEGWARALGVQGKIKGDSATRGVTPCLHIDFYSAVDVATAPRLSGINNACCRIGPRHFTIVHDCSRDYPR